jgi:hypothetical protein
MLKSRIHRCKTIARGNAAKSAIRARVEHKKNRDGLFIRTIDIARARAKLALANFANNFDRLIFRERSAATG